MNTLVATRDRKHVMLPQDISIDDMSFPLGTKILKCETSPGGHMLLPITNYKGAKERPTKQVIAAAKQFYVGYLGDEDAPPDKQ